MTLNRSALLLCLSLFSLLLLVGCQAPKHRKQIPADQSTADKLGEFPAAKEQVRTPPPRAPWENWNNTDLGSPELRHADGLAAQGRLAEAAEAYRRAMSVAAHRHIREEALLRMLGTYLKLGRSSEVLTVTRSYAASETRSIEQLDPRVSLVVAFAYEARGDVNQALAWFSLVQKKAPPSSAVERQAVSEMQHIVRSIAVEKFDEYQAKWVSDSVLGPIFSNESLRRTKGASPEARKIAVWFMPQTYLAVAGEGEFPTDRQMTASTGEAVIGVLLPLSGRFATHGGRVHQGIKLAIGELRKQGREIRMVVGDTAGEPEQAAAEFLRLVRDEKPSLVLGPLLVKTTERIVPLSEEAGVPFLTFTKRQGIPQLSAKVFRLGATAQNQAAELVGYSVDSLNLRSFGVFHNSSSSSVELAGAFRREVTLRGGVVVREARYNTTDTETLKQAVMQMETSMPEAIFIADSLEHSWPLLSSLENSPLESSILLGPASWDDLVALRGYGRFIDGAVYVTPFFALSRNPLVSDFVSQYTAMYGQEPGLLSAQGYDAARYLLSTPGALEPGSRELMARLSSADNFYGVTGSLRVNDYGDVIRRMSVVRLINGEPIEVMSMGVATGFMLNDNTSSQKILYQ